MSTGDLLIGAAFLAVVVLACGVVAVRVVGRWGRGVGAGVERALALAVVFAAAFFAVHLIPGVLTILHRETVALAALALMGASLLLQQRPLEQPSGRRPAAGEPLERAAAIVGVAAVTLYLVALAFEHATEGLLQPDVASFHLPNIARWLEGASLWQVDDFISNRAPGNYPQTGDVYMLGAVLPFHADLLVRFVSLPFLALAGLGVFAAGRELGARAAPAALCAAAVVAMPCVGYLGVQGVADPEMLGLFAAGGYFLLRHARTGDRFDLALAGVGLGLCFGTRWYAVAAVAAVFVVWAGGSLAARREGLLRDAGVLAGLIALFGGFWLVRNWVQSGNPVFPVRVAPLGLEIFDAPRDRYRELEGFSLVHYAFEPGVWRDFFWRPFLDFMSFVAVLLWAAIPLAGIVAWRARAGDRASAGKVGALLAVAVLIALAYVITPYTAVGPDGAPVDAWVNARYVVPGLLVVAPALAWALTRIGTAGRALQGLLALAVLDAIRRSLDLPDGDAGPVAFVAAAALLAAAWALWARRGLVAAAGPGARTAVALGAAVLLAVSLVAFSDRYFDERYSGTGEPIAIVDDAPEGTRVGLLGEGWGIQPLFGARLENEVAYIGPRVDGMLRAYPSGDELAAAVEDGGYDLIYVQDIDSLDHHRPERQAQVLRDLGWRRIATGTNPSFGAAVTTQLYAPPG